MASESVGAAVARAEAVGLGQDRRGRARARRVSRSGWRAGTDRNRSAAGRTDDRRAVDRHAGEQMGRDDRLGRRLQEPAEGRASVKSTVRVPTDSTVTSRHDPAAGPLYPASWSTSIVNTTSSAVTGSPSCQRASSRSWNVQMRARRDRPSSARRGRARSSPPGRCGPVPRTPARRGRDRPASARVSGLTDTGRPRTPSRYGRTVTELARSWAWGWWPRREAWTGRRRGPR